MHAPSLGMNPGSHLHSASEVEPASDVDSGGQFKQVTKFFSVISR
jgi:hypothetical protein